MWAWRDREQSLEGLEAVGGAGHGWIVTGYLVPAGLAPAQAVWQWGIQKIVKQQDNLVPSDLWLYLSGSSCLSMFLLEDKEMVSLLWLLQGLLHLHFIDSEYKQNRNSVLLRIISAFTLLHLEAAYQSSFPVYVGQ